MSKPAFALLVIYLCFRPATAGAVDLAPSLDLHPTSATPVIDGRLDDIAWLTAAHSDGFRQVKPLENVSPTEHTEFWLMFDADNIYGKSVV